MLLPPRLPSTPSSPRGEVGWFENEIQEAEQAFLKEQKIATEHLLKRQRQILGEALEHAAAQSVAQGRALAMIETPVVKQPTHRDVHEDSEAVDSTVDSTNAGRSFTKSNSFHGEIKAKNCIQRSLLPFTNSFTFEVITAIFVVAYSVLLGIQVHIDMAELLGTKPHAFDGIRANIDTAASFLVVAYFIEIVVRLVAEQRDFFCGKNCRWNLFDIIILFISISDMALKKLPDDDGAFELLAQFKVLRVLRFFRNLRILTFFKLFTDLRMMLWSVVSCMHSFLWAMVLLAIFFYMVAILLEDSAMVMVRHLLDKQESLGNLASKELDENIHVIKSGLAEHWDGLYKGIFSLIFSISGGDDWANIGAPFFRMHWALGAIFTMFILVSLFGILNVLIGIFVQKAGEIELWDRELALLATDLHHQTQNETYKMLFREIDTDCSNFISLNELRRRLSGPDEDKRIQNYFRHLGIDIDSAAHGILDALDSNGDGVLSLDEFVMGCRKLQGVARPAQLEQLMLKIDNLKHMLHHRGMPLHSYPAPPL